MSSEAILDYLIREVNTLSHKRRTLRSDRTRVLEAIRDLSRRGDLAPSIVSALRRLATEGDLETLRSALGAATSELRRHERTPLTASRIENLQFENTHLRELVEEQQSRLEDLQEAQEDSQVSKEETQKEENMLEAFNTSKSRVFVIMPFSEDFKDVWRGAIRRACQETKFAPLRVDEIQMSSGITDDIKQYVNKSQTVVVDVTNNNPNVLYEFGYSLGKGKNPIIICQKHWAPKIPFDISGMRYLSYDYNWQGIEELTKGLKKYLEETFKAKKRKVKKSKAKS